MYFSIDLTRSELKSWGHLQRAVSELVIFWLPPSARIVSLQGRSQGRVSALHRLCSSFQTVPSPSMHPSRGVLFFALTLLAVQVLAEGVRETKELGSFSSELDAASGARLVRNHAENIAAKTARSFKSASSYDGDAAGAFEENMIYQDSSSRRYAHRFARISDLWNLRA